MHPIGEMAARHIVRRTIIGLLIAAVIGGIVMMVAIELVKRSL